MRGGVVSDVVHKQLGLRGLDILLNGESLDTDLTGLQIRQDAKFEALLSSLHYNPKQLKNQAREAVGDLKVSSVPPRYGNMNSGLGCLAGIAMTYILIKVQLLVAVRYGDAASKVAMAALLFLFYQAFIKADRMGFRISHAPQGFEKHVIGVMLDKLK